MSKNKLQHWNLKTKKCTIKDCIVDVGQHKLQCSTSKGWVHIRCILLTTYQLQCYLLFVKNYCTFTCVNWVEVPKYLQKINRREPNEVFQEKYEKELERFCNLKKEIATLKEALQNKGNELYKMRFKLNTMTNAEETPSNLNKKKQKRSINKSTSFR